VPERDPTCIGRVRQVLGAQVTVALDEDLAGIAPIYRGELHRVGQIGSLVRLPQGLVDLVGQVSLVGIAELSGPAAPTQTVQVGERWLQIELLGEIDRGSGRFRRGVGIYPGLDDPVHFTTTEDLQAVYPLASETTLRLGALAAADQVPVCLDVGPLVTRHSAIVGSTGSGKTSTVASILQGFTQGGWDAANVVVIDPHGEYASALGGHASVRSVLGAGDNGIRVPYWALPAADILVAFAGSTGGATTQSRFAELVAQARRVFAASATWLTIDASAVTADSPIPFNLREVWYELDAENNETRKVANDPSTIAVDTEGDPAALSPRQFEPYKAGGAAPFKGPLHGIHGTVPELLRLGLLDPRLAFLMHPAGDPAGEDPLVAELANWLGRDKPVSILDFSGVPAEASDIAIGVILDLIFETALRTPNGADGIGRPRPVLVVLEEAHRYLGETSTTLSRRAANRIAREGRKYGVGLMLVTQRPSELPDTALAQCGTLIALRLSNAADQGEIRAALPDSVAGLAAVLPSLRTGEAIVTGEALTLPARTVVDAPSPFPDAHDPSLASWRKPASTPDVAAALQAWRGTYHQEEKT
jgi:DNA helicase HerA-like ATPase